MVYRSEKGLSQGIVEIRLAVGESGGGVLMVIVVGPPIVDNTIPRQKVLGCIGSKLVIRLMRELPNSIPPGFLLQVAAWIPALTSLTHRL